MSRKPIRSAAGVFAAVALLAAAPPSDPVGVFAVIDRVVVAPDTTNPTTIQIWGSFSVTDKGLGEHYSPPVKGYLYYRLNSQNVQASRAEWADLRRIAGSKAIVGFSAKWQSNTPGRVRCATDPVANADEYPIQSGMGIVRMSDQGHPGFAVVKDFFSAKVPDAPCGKVK